jgi:hypothetical protein
LREVFEGLCREYFERVEVEVAGLVCGVEAGGLEEDGVGVVSDECVDVLREVMPGGHAVLRERSL